MKIAIIGLGYVGLPLALQFAKSGVEVLGLDIDVAKIDFISQKRSYIKHISSESLGARVEEGTFSASTDLSRVEECGGVIICVPTPLNKNREPDISYILKTGERIASSLRKGTVVVLESTTYPGTTTEALRPVLERGSGLVAGTDFYLAYSPEREDPANPASTLESVPKVIGGYTEACLARAIAIYSKAIRTLVPVSSCEVAEAAKLLENIYRSVNIALVNELKVVYDKMGINIWEVIEAAKTKPFGFTPFYPGPGLGGHCIPIDPFYLTWKAREFGVTTRFIELAGEVNTAMPGYVIEKVAEALNSRCTSIRGSRILLVGLAYKPNVDDERESPTWQIMELLRARGAEIAYYDPHIPVVCPIRQHPQFEGMRSVNWDAETLRGFSVIVICTAHDGVDYDLLLQHGQLIVDTRNALTTKKVKVWKA
jgi:UDP-N-acetyl-D-glucosamine dehydrogenase